jgi:hypothetical protein
MIGKDVAAAVVIPACRESFFRRIVDFDVSSVERQARMTRIYNISNILIGGLLEVI